MHSLNTGAHVMRDAWGVHGCVARVIARVTVLRVLARVVFYVESVSGRERAGACAPPFRETATGGKDNGSNDLR